MTREMEDIELVIKIPEEMYKWVNEVNKFSDDYGISDFIDLVKNGTLLPEGHGRLGDLSKIYVELNEAQIEGTEEYKGLGEAKQMICDAKTIIEAR